MVCALSATTRAADLRTINSEHYSIHTDLDTDFAVNLGQRMDAMWNEYARRLEDFPLPDANKRFDAYVFERRIDYMKLIGDRLPNTGGVYDSHKQLLAVFVEDQGRDRVRHTLQHEAFHQFADIAVGAQIPAWLNEGLAQIFEEGIWTGDRFVIGQAPPHRVELLRSDRAGGRIIPFREFVSITPDQWIINLRDRTKAISQYNQAWAMAQFLVYSKGTGGKSLYVDNLVDMLKLIHHGVTGRKAFELAFSDNYQGFEQRFDEWADTLAPSAQATYSEQQNALADMMVQLYGSGQRFGSILDLRSYLMSGGFTLNINGRSMLPDNCFCDASGHPFGPDQLFLYPRQGTPAPDLIYRPRSGVELRTQFTQEANALSYETTLLSP